MEKGVGVGWLWLHPSRQLLVAYFVMPCADDSICHHICARPIDKGAWASSVKTYDTVILMTWKNLA